MSKHIFVIGLFLFIASTAFANGNCAQNSAGKIVCAPPGGTITKDKNDEVVCGLGNCVVTMTGTILCSGQPGGSAIINNQGKAECTRVCVSASRNTCKGAR